MALWSFLLWPFLIVHSSMRFVAFGDVPVVRPAGEPARVVILFSGDQGVGPQEAAAADALAMAGALVFEVDTPRYLEDAGKGKGHGVNAAADFEELGQNGEARLQLASYHPPILVGAGSGATFAEATLAEAPAGTYMGAVSLGFDPVLQVARVETTWEEAEAARVARRGELADLPLVEVPASAPEIDALAVDVTGSGGFTGLDVEIGKALTARGVPLVAWSSLDYFWKPRDPQGAGRDLTRVLDHYLKAWHKSRALLIGYSQGADVVPFMVNRLPAKLRSRVGVVGLIGPDGEADFEERRGAPPLPVAPEISKLTDRKLVCVYGKREKLSLCPKLGPRLSSSLFTVPGGHAFSGDAPLLVDRLLRDGGWAGSSTRRSGDSASIRSRLKRKGK